MNRLKFLAIRQYFDKKGILMLSAKFLTEHLPNEFDNIENAKNYLKRTLKIDFNPYETKEYIIKTNVVPYVDESPYVGEAPTEYLQQLSLAKNPATINFYIVYFKGQGGRNTIVVSRYDNERTKKAIEALTKKTVVFIHCHFEHKIDTGIYGRIMRDRGNEIGKKLAMASFVRKLKKQMR